MTDPRVDAQWGLRQRHGFYASATGGLSAANDLTANLFSVYDIFGFATPAGAFGDLDDEHTSGFFDS